VDILELTVSAKEFVELFGRNVFPEILVEFEFFASRGVDKWGNQLEKEPYKRGDYNLKLASNCPIVLGEYGGDH
jgi:hypothetical protein